MKARDTELRRILAKLNDDQRSRESRLRSGLLEAFEACEKSARTLVSNRTEVGKILVELRDEVIPKRFFKDYLKGIGLPPATAYRLIGLYEETKSLPRRVLEAAVVNGVDIGSRTFEAALQAHELPKDPSEEDAAEFVTRLVETRKASKALRRKDAMTPEGRLETTLRNVVQTYLRLPPSSGGERWLRRLFEYVLTACKIGKPMKVEPAKHLPKQFVIPVRRLRPVGRPRKQAA
ncbi:MAG: hypothetical protein ACE145_20515 [Terriglobia bacterium]